ncbi:hypothetical protein VIBNISOn1_1050042 [Vibrio nigripulchritudo SOn1]|uniref:DUF1281 domain-containing protein n=1 Tax=Vibrio nigripulchritudo SOn1 TaxID=1238450 RepID=A0AAV2VHU3_9VIBR|nr:DUF1281 domain-containing protein [Vibrio nigripulchritudo]CCO44216.1 hypothetical protein VIBNISOn1_1050042 [Vibrio nigripulchritudo SOn1]
MPNWCSNALFISGTTDEAQKVIDSLLDGSIELRTNEMVYKMRKMFLSGVTGLLVPHTTTEQKLLDEVGLLHPNLNSQSRSSSPESLAYTEFLYELCHGNITPENYEHINRIYLASRLGQKWYGDIPKPIRKRLRAVWKTCRYDYSGMFKVDISAWWSKPNVWEPQQQPEILDLQLLVELPIKVMVNGFNGGLLRCSTEYDFNCHHIGIKWTELEVTILENGNWSFDTPWSPPHSIIELLPRFVEKQLSSNDGEELVDITLYYYEAGCAFQGIDHDVYAYIEHYDEDGEQYSSNMLPEITAAFN